MEKGLYSLLLIIMFLVNNSQVALAQKNDNTTADITEMFYDVIDADVAKNRMLGAYKYVQVYFSQNSDKYIAMLDAQLKNKKSLKNDEVLKRSLEKLSKIFWEDYKKLPVDFFEKLDVLDLQFEDKSDKSKNSDDDFTPKAPGQPCYNVDFETGDFSNWDLKRGTRITGNYAVSGMTTVTPADGQHTIVGAGNDPLLGAVLQQLPPGGGTYAARLGDLVASNGYAASMSQTFLVDANSTSFVFKYAVVLEDGAHNATDQAFFQVNLYDKDGNSLACGNFAQTATDATSNGFVHKKVGSKNYYYLDWVTAFIPLTPYIGENITIEFIVTDCRQKGHLGYAYVDASCSPLEVTQTKDFICEGNEVVTLTAPPGAKTYLWSPDNQNTQAINVTQAGNYSVKITPNVLTGAEACAVTVPVFLDGAKATADFTPTPLIICENESIDVSEASFVTSFTPGNDKIVDWKWDFNGDNVIDASTQNPASPAYTYATSGTYNATLTVTTEKDCWDTKAVSIIVNPRPTAVINGTTTVCKDEAKPTITFTGSDGTAPYTFTYTLNGGAQQVITTSSGNSISLPVDTDVDGTFVYELISVEDNSATNCSNPQTGTATITVKPLPTATINGTTAVCRNDAQPTVTFEGFDGAAPYTFTYTLNEGAPQAISTGAGSDVATISVNTAVDGTYQYELLSVQEGSANLCSNSQSGIATITVNELPVIQIDPSDLTHNCQVSGATGSAEINVSGGLATYEYSLDGGTTYQTTNTFTNLTSHSYTVTVKDQNGCLDTENFTIDDPANGTPLTVSVDPSDLVHNCQVGGAQGSAVITVSGGYPVYEYSLDNGATYQSGNSFTNLTSQTYTVTVRDTNNCIETATFTIDDPAGDIPLTVSVDPSDLVHNCQVGGAQGSAVITVSGGYPVYEYSLDNGATYQSGNSFTNLTSQTYTVTVRDTNNCIETATFTIDDPAGDIPLTVSVDPSDLVHNCQVGGAQGSAVISVSGGYPVYEYSLDNGATYQSGNSFTNLTSQTYTVTVRDTNNCIETANFTIDDPAGGIPLTVSVDPSDLVHNCQVGGAQGSAVISVSGGYPVYEYSLDNGTTYQSGNSFTNLTSQTYTVTVRDTNNCIETANFTIDDPANGTPLTVSVAPSDLVHNCQVGGAQGSAVITVSGGYPVYEYSLDNGATYQSGNSFTNLTSQTYTVTVRDTNNCIETANFTIDDPAGGIPLTVSVDPSDLVHNCQVGGAQGSAVITVSGGYPVYEYSLDNGATYQSGNSFTNLTSQTYTVTVRDTNNCIETATFTIDDPAGGIPLTVSVDPSDLVHNCQVGGAQGSAVISVSGGYPVYEYSLDNGTTYQSGNSFTNLTSQTYTVTVRDTNNCIETANFTIDDPANGTPLTVSVAPSDLVHNCQVGGAQGSAVITVSGGYPVYEYSLDNGATYQSGNSFTNLTSQTYTVTVRDTNNCIETANFTIDDPAGGIPLTVSVDPSDLVHNCQVGGAQGSAVITVSGGYPVYEYSLDNGTTYQSGNSFTNLTSQTYTVIVRDTNNCIETATFTIDDPAGGIPLTVSVDPSDLVHNCQVGGAQGSAVITVSGGYPVYEYSLDNGATYQSGNSFTNLTSQTYTVTVRDTNNCIETANFTIDDPAGGIPLTVSVDPSDLVHNCQVGGAQGSAVISVSGGYPVYEYSLDNGATYQSGNSFTNLTSQTYTVTVRDTNNCIETANFTIDDPAGGIPLTVSVDPSDLVHNCQVGGAQGSAVITVSGGYPVYEYSLDNGATYQSGNSFTNLTSQTYTVTVRDTNNCIETANFTIDDPAGGIPLTVSVDPSDLVHNCQVGGAQGSAVISVSGGYPVYEYSLDNGATYQSGNSFTNLTSQTYTVTVRDTNNCIETANFTIDDPAGGIPLTVSVDPSDLVHNCQVGGAQGSAVITVSGGYPVYEYSLDNGATYQSGNSFTNLTSQTYTVTVRDTNNCIETANFTIDDPAGGIPLTVSVDPSDLVHNCQVGGAQGSAVITVSGGYPVYEYSLDNGATYQSGNSFTNLTSQTYTVIVRDTNNCIETATFTIDDPAGGIPLTVSVDPSDLVHNCQVGGAQGSAVITVSGGYPVYEYSLDNGATYQSGNSFTNLTSQTYTVTVRDTNNCIETANFTIVDILQTATITVDQNTICQYDANLPTITFVGSGGTAPYTFAYTINGGATQTVVSIGNTATVVVPTDVDGTFTYSLVSIQESSITSCNIPVSGTATVVVKTEPIVTLTVLDDEICSGESISIVPSSTPVGSTFSWTTQSNGVTGANNGVGTIVTDVLTNPGVTKSTVIYSFQGTLNGCVSKTVDTMIIVKPLPMITAVGDTICSGEITDIPINTNISGTDCHWTEVDYGVIGATDGSGMSINQELFSATGGMVEYTVSPTYNGCVGPSITVSAYVNGLPTVGISSSQVEICQGDVVTLTASGAQTYAWSPSNSLDSPVGTTVNATPQQTTEYTVIGTDVNGCQGEEAIEVVVHENPTVTVNPDSEVCYGSSVLLTANGAETYTWSPSTGLNVNTGNTVSAQPYQTTTYQVVGKSDKGCIGVDSVTVTVNPLPIVKGGGDQGICRGGLAILSGSGAVTYVWNNNVVDGTPFVVDTTRTFSVTGTDAKGCQNTDYVTIFALESPEVSFVVDTTFGCAPITVQFTNNTIGANSYFWDFGDGKTSTAQNPFHDYTEAGCYDVTLIASNNQGCSTTMEMGDLICASPSPTAAFVASTYEITNVMNEVFFSNQSQNATSYEWFFGDEFGYSTSTNPKYEYDPSIIRNYMVTLVAQNDEGCTDTARVVIKMDEEVVIYVPNAFTPDGDEFNNVFKPVIVEGFDFNEYELLLFNRWGELIFETRDINYGWDGTYLGKLCQDGSYVWKITIKRSTLDDRITKTGHVTLIK